jgi:hypothetical protein
MPMPLDDEDRSHKRLAWLVLLVLSHAMLCATYAALAESRAEYVARHARVAVWK